MKIGQVTAALLLGASISAGLAGCDKSRDEMRPQLDTVTSENGLQSKDIREMTDRMAPDMLQIPEIANNPTRVTIVVKGMQNKTETEPGRNFDLLSARLAGLLNSSAARDRILFIEERKTTDRMRAEELGNPDPFEDASRGRGAPDATIKPQFFLYGTVFSMSGGKTTYYMCEFRLTSSVTGAVVWNKQYETKTLNLR